MEAAFVGVIGDSNSGRLEFALPAKEEHCRAKKRSRSVTLTPSVSKFNLLDHVLFFSFSLAF